MSRNFDSPWKETLELFLKPILQMLFPDIHAEIDWSKGYESLDTELRAVVADGELGSTLADKLFRVYLRDGTDVWILIHLEVQSQPDPDFARLLDLSPEFNRPFARVRLSRSFGTYCSREPVPAPSLLSLHLRIKHQCRMPTR
jgi:hypothetical protein